MIISLSIVGQLIAQLAESLNKASFNQILNIVYILLIIIVVGYGFIAWGAKKLSKLEDL